MLYVSHDKNTYHPTPKPVALLDKFILNSSKEGDVVLDCFMGSGSTGESCIINNRKFIGMEKEQKYFDYAVERLKQIEFCKTGDLECLTI